MVDEVFVVPLVQTLCTLVESRLHGDNLNRARLRAGVTKCLQTVTRHNRSQYLMETILNVIKGMCHNTTKHVVHGDIFHIATCFRNDIRGRNRTQPGNQF